MAYELGVGLPLYPAGTPCDVWNLTAPASEAPAWAAHEIRELGPWIDAVKETPWLVRAARPGRETIWCLSEQTFARLVRERPLEDYDPPDSPRSSWTDEAVAAALTAFWTTRAEPSELDPMRAALDAALRTQHGLLKPASDQEAA